MNLLKYDTDGIAFESNLGFNILSKETWDVWTQACVSLSGCSRAFRIYWILFDI